MKNLFLRYYEEEQRIEKENNMQYSLECWHIGQNVVWLEKNYLNERAAFEDNLAKLEKYIAVHQQLLDAGRKILAEAEEEAGEA